MGFLTSRYLVVSTCLSERIRRGAPEVVGPIGDEVLLILDGVGRFQFAPAVIRRVLREDGRKLATVLYDWQFGLIGEIWTDLMWLRRNRLMGAKLARKLLAFRRAYPDTTIHLLAASGGAGIAVFACERLRGRALIETLILACPALSPGYNLGPALAAVKRAYGLVSRRDRAILGLGTSLFGTTDRRFTAAGGMRGFHIPADASPQDRAAYERFREIRWTPEFREYGHFGGHAGYLDPRFIRAHLFPLLRGEPRLPLHVIPVAGQMPGR